MRRLSISAARTGFTLLEMLVVLVVLGLLAGLIGPQLFGRVGEAKATTAKTQMELIGVALDSYRLDNGAYPTTQQGLLALRCVDLGAVRLFHDADFMHEIRAVV